MFVMARPSPWTPPWLLTRLKSASALRSCWMECCAATQNTFGIAVAGLPAHPTACVRRIAVSHAQLRPRRVVAPSSKACNTTTPTPGWLCSHALHGSSVHRCGIRLRCDCRWAESRADARARENTPKYVVGPATPCGSSGQHAGSSAGKCMHDAHARQPMLHPTACRSMHMHCVTAQQGELAAKRQQQQVPATASVDT